MGGWVIYIHARNNGFTNWPHEADTS